MLEKMDEFFNRRVNGYEEHQLTAIEGAEEFYPFTASVLPKENNAKVLDLGCGTGLELKYYFKINPTAEVTCIDIAKDMLRVLKEQFRDKSINIIEGSYFDIPFENSFYNAVVSVESLHHFSKEEKLPLYKKVFQTLQDNGYFILTDYFANSNEEEIFFQKVLERLKEQEEINDHEFYHFDTPLTVEHEMQILLEAGFSYVEIVNKWGATCIVKAIK